MFVRFVLLDRVKFAGLIHPGLIGTAPSTELLDMWNTREKALVDEEGTANEKTLCGCLHTRYVPSKSLESDR